MSSSQLTSSLNCEILAPLGSESHPSHSNTRKRLLEQALYKDRISSRTKSISITKSSEKLSLSFSSDTNFPIKSQNSNKPDLNPSNPQNFSSSFSSQSQVLNDIFPQNPKDDLYYNFPIAEKPQRSKSPTCTKRNNSYDMSKNLFGAIKFPRGQSAERIRSENPVGKKTVDNPPDYIGNIASQFTVKKIQDLKDCSIKGNEDMGRAFIALMYDADYHIKNSGVYSLEVFLDYISSPGIVVQTLKKISMLIATDKISDSKEYLENIISSYEIFSKIDTVTSTPGHLLLASLLSTVYKFKGLSGKYIRFIKPNKEPIIKPKGCSNCPYKSEKRLDGVLQDVRLGLIEKKSKKQAKKVHSRAESVTIFSSAPMSKEDTFIETPLDKSECEISFNKTIDPIFIHDINTAFKDTKKTLLDKFFSRMQNPLPITEDLLEKNSFQDLNKSSECLNSSNDTKNFTENKNNDRPCSVSPMLNSKNAIGKEADKKTIGENKGKIAPGKSKIEEFKRKNIIIGSRFYKKLDDKFTEIIYGKMQKDMREIKKFQTSNLEEYIRKKADFILKNKDLWVKDTIKDLEKCGILYGNNENNSLVEIKHKAFVEYISQEKVISQLVFRAMQMDLPVKKVYK